VPKPTRIPRSIPAPKPIRIPRSIFIVPKLHIPPVGSDRRRSGETPRALLSFAMRWIE